jgi:hypothetical protein
LVLCAAENPNLITYHGLKKMRKKMEVHHGHNDKMWKDVIDIIENGVQVWNSRKLTYKGKIIPVHNHLISYYGFKIEMKGIPDKFEK